MEKHSHFFQNLCFLFLLVLNDNLVFYLIKITCTWTILRQEQAGRTVEFVNKMNFILLQTNTSDIYIFLWYIYMLLCPIRLDRSLLTVSGTIFDKHYSRSIHVVPLHSAA
jgi:hypothetical protein